MIQCYLEIELKRKGYGKRMLTFCVGKCMFKTTEQRLLAQAKAFRRKWMIGLGVEDFTRDL